MESFFNKPIVNILAAIFLSTIGIFGAYYFVHKSTPFVAKNVTIPPAQGVLPLEVSQQQPNPPAPSIKSFTIHDIENAHFYKPYLEDRPYFFLNSGSPATFKEGFVEFDYCNNNPCELGKTKRGTMAISHVVKTNNPSLFITYGTGADGLVILSVDFGDREKRTYLAAFVLNTNDPSSEKQVYFTNTKNLGTLGGAIQSVDITENAEVNISTKNLSSNMVTGRTFLASSGRNFSTFAELTPDKLQKIYDDYNFGYHFVYPKDVTVHPLQTSRDLELETQYKKSLIYFMEGCGLQPTFADGGNYFSLPNTNGFISAFLSVHKTNDNVVYLTSSLYGYDPLDWGKIKQKVYIADYVNAIKKGAGVWEREVTLEDIHGYSVRHIAPFSQGKPCDTQTREQYQWVSGDLLFNLIFTESKDKPALPKLKSELLNDILLTLKVS